MAANLSQLHVVVAGTFLDPQRRKPSDLVRAWRDFGRVPAAAARHGVRVTLLQAGWEDVTIDIDGVPCHFVKETEPPYLGIPLAPAWRRIPHRLLHRMAECAPDVIHYEGLILPRLARAITTRFKGVPVIAQDHGSKPPRGWRRVAWRWGFAGLSGVTFTSAAQAEAHVSAGILPRALPVFEVVEGSSPFTPGDQLAAKAALRMDGDPCLLWVGNLDANKDPDTVLEAVAAAKLPRARLYMYYRHAPLLPGIRARVARPDLAGRVELRGEIGYPAIEDCFRAADFVLQASHDEGSGYGIIEALACGATPIVTDIPAFRRITGNGSAGALVPLEDPGAMARALEEWNRRDRAALRAQARAHFERELSFDAIGRQLATAYLSVWSARG